MPWPGTGPFRQNDVVVPVWRIHRAIGMGGDQLIAALAGDEVEEEKGDDIRDTEKPLYMAMIEEVEPFEGAKELVRDLSADRTVVLASSAKDDEVDHYLDLLDARKVVAGWTTSADVEETKPEPDLVEAALEKASTRQAVLVGDSVWDCEAAKRAGIESVAVLTGGYAEAELKGAGAREVLDSVANLGENSDVLDEAGEPS
jgi:HAD superfamily hydrolase (TIGR01549 family)